MVGGMADITVGTVIIMVGGTTVGGGILGPQYFHFYHFITRQL
jgi:hypothetical protein